MAVLHKKSRQTLTVSPESPFDWNFLKVGSVIVYSFIKNLPNLQGPPLPLPHLRAQAIKCVYVINYSWYVHQYEPVCTYMNGGGELKSLTRFCKAINALNAYSIAKCYSRQGL